MYKDIKCRNPGDYISIYFCIYFPTHMLVVEMNLR